MLQLKNIKTGDTYEIPPEGHTMGRAGAKADIQIADPGISKKHARLYQQGGAWYLEDVGSSNGTYIQGKRLTEPVPVQEGLVFGMSRNKFQVVSISANGVADDEMLFDQDLPPPDDVPAPGPPLPPPGPPPGMPRQADPYAPPQDIPPQAYGQPPPQYPPPNGAQTAPPQTAPPQYAQQQQPHPGQPQGQAPLPVPNAGGDDAGDMSVGYFMAAIPKAIAYYMARVPLLVFNPMGTIRKSYEEQPLHPMGKAELMVYAFPALAFSSLFGILAGMIASLVRGAFTFPIVSAVISVVVAAVVAVIFGFIAHPFTGWLIRLLKGESDARSRTNYFMIQFTLTIVLAVPSGLGVILASIPVPLVPALAPLVQLVGTALSLLVAYKWAKFFGLHKVIPILILVFGGLAVLGTVGSFGMAVWGGVQQILNGGGGAVVEGDNPIEGGGDVDLDDLEIPDSLPKESQEALQKQLESIKQMKAAGVSDDTIQGAVNGFRTALAAASGTPIPTPNPGTDDPPDTPTKPNVKPVADPNPGGAKPDMSFTSFRSKRAKIESKISSDPSLLKGEVRNLYGALSKVEYEAEQEFTKRMSKSPELRLVHERDRDATVWRKAASIVGQLSDKL